MDTILATAQYLTFRLAEEIYGIDVRSVREILELPRITRIPRLSSSLLGVMNVRGRVVPVVDLRVKLGMQQEPPTENSAVVIVERPGSAADTLIGVLVDSVAEVLTVENDAVQPPPKMGAPVEAQLLYGMVRGGDDFVLLLRIENVFTDEAIEQVS